MISRVLMLVVVASAVAAATAAVSSVKVAGQTETASRGSARTARLPGAEAVKVFVAARTAKNWVVPKKPWGDPDIEGIFTTKDEAGTPFERPDAWAGRQMEDITKAELAAAIVKWNEDSVERISQIRQMKWGGVSPFDLATINSRPWFVIDPPDGKVPALTAEGKRRVVPSARRADTYADRSVSERCLAYGALSPPGSYSNSHQIIQASDHVVIRQERIHEARIVPLDGRPHPSSSIRGYFGVSRGHWEGNTLVVVTTNFHEQMVFRGSPVGNVRLIERFTRTAPDKVEWSTTFDDPTTWTRPWTWSIPMTKDDAEMILEFACHEGNTGVPNILSAGRAAEKKQAREGGPLIQ